MRKSRSHRLSLTLFALALYASGSSNLLAQDRPDEHHDQKPQEHHDEMRGDHPDAMRDDPVARYRHDHPNSSARCHDGFFTRTADRNHACRKHGGIDVWLAM